MTPRPPAAPGPFSRSGSTPAGLPSPSPSLPRKSAPGKWLAATAAAASIAFGGASASAAVLAESDPMEASGVSGVPVNGQARFTFSVFDVGRLPPGTQPPESARRLVFERLIDADDVGQTILFPTSEFPEAFVLLSNGVDNPVEYRVYTTDAAYSGSFGATDTSLLFNTILPRDRFDYAGMGVTAIGLKVHRLRLNDPIDGAWEYSLTLVAVPEPSTAAMLIPGGLVLRRRWGNRR